jgi:hypothetical protein
MRIRLGITAVAALVFTSGLTAGQRVAQPLDLQAAALTRMRDAVNRGDARGYADVYSADASITIFGANDLRGRDAIEKHERELLSQFPGTRFEFFDTWHGRDIVVAHYGVNWRGRSGAMGHEGLLFFRFNVAGEIVSEERYLDSLTPMAQMGALPGSQPRALPVLPERAREHGGGASAERSNVEEVRRVLLAIDRRRPPPVDDLAAATFIDELIFPEPFTGTDAGRLWLRDIEGLADTRFDIRTMLGVGRHVLVAGIWHGRVVRRVGPAPPSERPFKVNRALIVELNERREIVLIRAFMNGRELAESVAQ